MRVPAPGAFADQIDHAGDLAGLVADRNFAQDQRAAGHGLQRLEGGAHRGFGLIHLVDVEQVRDGAVVEELQDRRQGDRAFGHRFADHHDDIGHHHRALRLVGQFDRAGAVDQGPGLAQIGDAGDRHLGAHRPGAGLGRAVADGVAVPHRAAAVDRARREQQVLEQGGLATGIGANKGRAARA